MPKKFWTEEEEEALSAGVEKHGPGSWQKILTDPEFSRALAARSNGDLKDKWRNIEKAAAAAAAAGAAAESSKGAQEPEGSPDIYDPLFLKMWTEKDALREYAAATARKEGREGKGKDKLKRA